MKKLNMTIVELQQKLLEAGRSPGPQPSAHYDKSTDSITVMFSHGEYYADIIDEYITVLKDPTTEEIVGAIIDRISSLAQVGDG